MGCKPSSSRLALCVGRRAWPLQSCPGWSQTWQVHISPFVCPMSLVPLQSLTDHVLLPRVLKHSSSSSLQQLYIPALWTFRRHESQSGQHHLPWAYLSQVRVNACALPALWPLHVIRTFSTISSAWLAGADAKGHARAARIRLASPLPGCSLMGCMTICWHVPPGPLMFLLQLRSRHWVWCLVYARYVILS